MARMLIYLGIVFGVLFIGLRMLETFLQHHPWSALPAMLLFG